MADTIKNELILDKMKARVRDLKKNNGGKYNGCIGIPAEMFDQMLAEAKACGREKEIKYARIAGSGLAKAPKILGVHIFYPSWQDRWMADKKEAVIKSCKEHIKNGEPLKLSEIRDIMKVLNEQAWMLEEKRFELSAKHKELNDTYVTCAQLRREVAEKQRRIEKLESDKNWDEYPDRMGR